MGFQILTLPSTHPEARRPSGPHASELILPVCPRRVRSSWPVVAFQILTVSSTLPVASLCPLGSQASDMIRCECRSGPTTIFSEATSQILAVKSPLAEASRAPSGLHAKSYSPQRCPRSVTILSPACVPEMVTVPSPCPAARSLSSGLHAPARTPPGWAISAVTRPVLASQILMVPSSPQADTRVPPALKATDQIGDLWPPRTWSSRPEPASQT